MNLYKWEHACVCVCVCACVLTCVCMWCMWCDIKGQLIPYCIQVLQEVVEHMLLTVSLPLLGLWGDPSLLFQIFVFCPSWASCLLSCSPLFPITVYFLALLSHSERSVGPVASSACFQVLPRVYSLPHPCSWEQWQCPACTDDSVALPTSE